MQTLSVYYDGQCPFCTRYMQYYRLAEGDHTLVLVDIRSDPVKLAEFNERGLDIDEGMIVQVDEAIYFGPAAIRVLALLSSQSGWFNRINRWIFSRPKLAKVIYPLLVAGRNLALRLLGIGKINR